MTADRPPPDRLVPSLLSGPDWAKWLRRAHAGPVVATSVGADGQVPAWAWDSLVHLARRQGFAVIRGDYGDSKSVTSWPYRRIRISAKAMPAQAFTELAHQLGHVLLHGEIARLEPRGIVPCSGTRQVEADSVAYLVTVHLSIDTAITFPHVSSWAGTDPRARPGTTIQAVSDRVLAAAAVITRHLDAEHGVAPKPPEPVLTADTKVSRPAEPAPIPASDLVRVQEAAAQFFREQMQGSWVPDYLNGRGFGPAIQSHWHAGYAPARWDVLTSHLRATGYSDPLIEAAGLARRSRRGTLIDAFRDRAMLPIRSDDGTIVAFIGRAAPHAGPKVPKYLNTPHTDLYDKSSVLFGLWQGCDALAQGAHPVIAEGPFDAIAITTAGSGGYVGLAPCGTALTARQLTTLDRLASLRTVGALVAFDPDEAGRRAAVKAFHLLRPFTDQAEAVDFPAGQDPAQILNDRGRETLAEMLASRTRPLADLVIEAEIAKWNRWLVYPGGQIRALRAAAPIIAALPPVQVARQVAHLAQRLDLDHATVTEAVTDALTAIVANGHTDDRSSIAAAEDDLPGRASAAARRASRDFPHPVREVTAHAAIAAPPSGQRRRSSADRAPLMTRRVPG